MDKEQVKKLASLSRMELSSEELEKMASEIESILSYIDQIKSVVASTAGEVGAVGAAGATVRNVIRDDFSDVANADSQFNLAANSRRETREKLLTEVPDRDGDHIKVKKIL